MLRKLFQADAVFSGWWFLSQVALLPVQTATCSLRPEKRASSQMRIPGAEISTGLSTRRLRLRSCGAFAEFILTQAPDFREGTADRSRFFPYEMECAKLKAPGGTGPDITIEAS